MGLFPSQGREAVQGRSPPLHPAIAHTRAVFFLDACPEVNLFILLHCFRFQVAQACCTFIFQPLLCLKPDMTSVSLPSLLALLSGWRPLLATPTHPVARLLAEGTPPCSRIRQGFQCGEA